MKHLLSLLFWPSEPGLKSLSLSPHLEQSPAEKMSDPDEETEADISRIKQAMVQYT
jgi:hypothetical protein